MNEGTVLFVKGRGQFYPRLSRARRGLAPGVGFGYTEKLFNKLGIGHESAQQRQADL
jgi:hypothetical protein